jgi:hypothetical protein
VNTGTVARVGVVCVAAAFHVGRQVDGIGEELAGSHYLIHRTSDNTHHTTKLFWVEFNFLFVFSNFFYNFKESLKWFSSKVFFIDIYSRPGNLKLSAQWVQYIHPTHHAKTTDEGLKYFSAPQVSFMPSRIFWLFCHHWLVYGEDLFKQKNTNNIGQIGIIKHGTYCR